MEVLYQYDSDQPTGFIRVTKPPVEKSFQKAEVRSASSRAEGSGRGQKEPTFKNVRFQQGRRFSSRYASGKTSFF